MLAMAPAAALAHEETGQAAGFLAGLSHPVSGLDHVLAMVAVGLWGAVLGPPAIWVLPVAFPLVMALGGLMGLLGIPVPGVEIGIAVSAIVLGAMVLAEARPSLWIAAAIVAFFAIFHGHAHGRELPEGTSALLYSLGFVVATGLLHAVGILLGGAHRWAVGRRAVRVDGGGVAAAGLFFLWMAIA
jgi:urease accessory protein